MHHIAACNATLDEVGKKIKKFKDSTVKRKMVWLFASDRTRVLLDEVSRYKENVNQALTADVMERLLRILSEHRVTKQTTNKILEETKTT